MHIFYLFKGFMYVCIIAGFFFLLIEFEKWQVKLKMRFLDNRFESRSPHSEQDARKCHLTTKDNIKWWRYFLIRFIPWLLLGIFICWYMGYQTGK